MAKLLTKETSSSGLVQLKREKLRAILLTAEECFEFSLGEEYVGSILIHLLISTERLPKGNNVSPQDELLFEQCSPTEMKISEFIAGQIEKEFHVIVPLSEHIYICMHLMGAIIYGNSPMQYDGPIVEDIKGLAMHLISHVSELTGIDFTRDRTLKTGLEFHLKLAVHRLRNEFEYSLADWPQPLQKTKIFGTLFIIVVAFLPNTAALFLRMERLRLL